MCALCGDRGLVRVNWADVAEDYAVCLCETGLRLRVNRNRGEEVTPLWKVWAFREGVELARIVLLEDILTPAELAAKGFLAPGQHDARSREAALLAAGKKAPR